MKILFAHSDRDLLACYKFLLESNGHEVSTAFDGVRVINYIDSEKFDIVLLQRDIPRASSDGIVAMLKKTGTPVIMLIRHKLVASDLLKDNIANSYLSFPFTPDELYRRIESVHEKTQNGESFDFYGINVDEKRYLFANIQVTAEEIGVIRGIKAGSDPDVKNIRTCVNSLNEKIRRSGSDGRINYVVNEGYRMVI